MIQNLLIGILLIGIIVIAALFNDEKKNNAYREEQLKQSIKESADAVKKDYMDANKDLLRLIENTKENLNSETKETVARIDKTIESAIQDADRKLSESVNERDGIISDLKTDNDNKLNLMSSQFNTQLINGIQQTQENMDSKIAVLANALEQVMMENAELKKKLEFFTEINEDSKNLNEKEDEAQRENLIQQALAELKTGPKKTTIEIPPINIPESEEPATSKPIEPVREKEDPATSKPIEPVQEKEETAARTDTVEDVKIKDTESEPNAKESQIIEADTAPSILDDEQKLAFTIMNSTNDNLFITGKAGTGKSFLLDVFVRGSRKKTIKLAPTGIAALNIGGATLHSAFGYNNLERLELDSITMGTIKLKSEKIRILKEVDTIIIDEISMVRADTFDKIDKILRVLNKSAKPFGGKQMIVFGDLFQLPPIAKSQELKYLTDYYGGIFFFNSNAYSNGQFGFIELSTNHRQKDDHAFFDILNRMREGKTTSSDINTLNSRYVSDRNELRRILTLFPKKADAERVNKEELDKIQAKEYKYKARIVYNAKSNQNPNLDAAFPITDELRLKRGALVMMVANDPEKRWVNGTMGVVHSLTESTIHVTIDGTTFEVDRTTFTEKEVVYKDGRMDYQDVLSVEQFPVVLAYAITIHKSQGMTYKKIACDITQCFAPGQAYVALSRCSSIAGLHLLESINSSMMKVDDSVMEFYLSQSTDKTFQKYS